MGCVCSSKTSPKKNNYNPDNQIPQYNNQSQLTSFSEANLNLKRMRELELEEHNRLRSLHGAPPLILNNELNQMAQNYAQVLAQKDVLEHSKNRSLSGKPGAWVGENLYYYSAYPVCEYKCGSMSRSWYDEIKDYDFKNGRSKGGVIGHFTQVVWKGTQYVGMGIASNGNNYFVVANYFTAGNWDGEYTNNVFQK